MTQLLPSELAKQAAESEGKTHTEAMKILKKENPDWAAGDLADVANSVSPTMDAASRKVQKRYQALTKSASTESSMLLPSELAKTSASNYEPQLGDRVQVRGGGNLGRVSKVPASPFEFDFEIELDKGITVKRQAGDLIYRGPKKASTEPSAALLPSELARMGKFPAGVSMTVDEVAAVVGDEFKEMNENPPPEVVALREEMMDKAAARPMPKADLSLIIKGRFPNARVTLSGLHGDGAEDISSFLRAAGFDGEFKVSSAEEAHAYMLKMLGVFKKHPEFEVGLGVDDLDLPELKIKWAGGSKTAAVADADLFEAVKSAKNVGQKIRNVKDAAWKLAIRAGYIQLKGMMFELTPMGEIYYEAMLLKPGFTRWADEEEKTARFEEGPEGAKQFEAWMEKQPQSVQDDWKKYTEENGDKFKTASDPREPLSLLNRAMIALSEVDLPSDPGVHHEFAAIANDLAGVQGRLRTFLRANGKMAADKFKVGDKIRFDTYGSDKSEGGKVLEVDKDGQVTKFEDKGGTIMTPKDVVSLRKKARFEEGQPADPTADMSPEDKAAWEANTEKYKDKFTDEEAMMDKFQDQLLPSETYSLKSARQRSTWPKVGTDRNSVLKFLCGDEFIYPPPQFGGVYYFSQEAPLAKSTAEAYIRRLRTRAERMGVTVTGEELQELYAARVQITLPESITASSSKEADIAEDLGATVPGPLVQDKEEKPFLSGQFTQVENSELSSKFEGKKVFGTLEWLE